MEAKRNGLADEHQSLLSLATLALPLPAYARVPVSISIRIPAPVVVTPVPVIVAPPPTVIVVRPPLVVGGYYGHPRRHWRHGYWGPYKQHLENLKRKGMLPSHRND